MAIVKETGKITINKVYRYLIATLIFFIFGAAVASLLGQYIDESLNIKPFGTIATMVVSYIMTFAIAYLLSKKFFIKNK
jgi:FtsH-binding integral membrane protein